MSVNKVTERDRSGHQVFVSHPPYGSSMVDRWRSSCGDTTHICLYSYRDFSWFDRANVTANIVIMDVKWFAILVCISLLASGHVGFGYNDFETPVSPLTYSSDELRELNTAFSRGVPTTTTIHSERTE